MLVSTRTQLLEMRDALAKADTYSFDIETTSKDKWQARITIFSFATDFQKWAVRVRDFSLEVIKEILAPIWSDPTKTCIFHHYNYDGIVLRRSGIEIFNILADTFVASWLWDEDPKRYSHGLKESVFVELNHTMTTFKESSGLWGNFEEYASEDAWWTLKLFRHYLSKLKEWGLLDAFWNIEMPIVRVLVNMESRGVKVSKKQLKLLKKKAYDDLERLGKIIQVFAALDLEQQRNLHQELNSITSQIKEENEKRIEQGLEEFDVDEISLERHYQKCKDLPLYKFEVSSPLQCANLLFDKLKIGMTCDGKNKYSERGKPTKSQPLGQFSTDDDTLSLMSMDDFPIADLILKFREIHTRKNNFILPLLERCDTNGDIIHPHFNQVRIVTGRIASDDPNFQNLPNRGGVRAAFINRDDTFVFVRADFSQAELRLIAHISKDPVMIANYRRNGDIHQSTADACGLKGKQGRQIAKVINFSLIYRETAKSLKHQLDVQGNIISLEDAYRFIKAYFSKYRSIKLFHNTVEKTGKARLVETGGKFGYIRTLAGRLRRIDAESINNPISSYRAITQLINAVVQGGVADMVKWAMIEIEKEFKRRGWLAPEKNIWDAYLINQIHDELIVECKKEISKEVQKIVEEKMEAAGIRFGICVPMKSDSKIVENLGIK